MLIDLFLFSMVWSCAIQHRSIGLLLSNKLLNSDRKQFCWLSKQNGGGVKGNKEDESMNTDLNNNNNREEKHRKVGGWSLCRPNKGVEVIDLFFCLFNMGSYNKCTSMWVTHEAAFRSANKNHNKI